MEWVATVKGDNPHDNAGIDPSHCDYFMLVNDEVLERFRVAEEKLAKENQEPVYCDEGVVAILCLGYEQEEDDDDDDWLEGRMWQYVCADAISELYDRLCDCGEWWITAFAWPPEVYGNICLVSFVWARRSTRVWLGAAWLDGYQTPRPRRENGQANRMLVGSSHTRFLNSLPYRRDLTQNLPLCSTTGLQSGD